MVESPITRSLAMFPQKYTKHTRYGIFDEGEKQRVEVTISESCNPCAQALAVGADALMDQAGRGCFAIFRPRVECPLFGLAIAQGGLVPSATISAHTHAHACCLSAWRRVSSF